MPNLRSKYRRTLSYPKGHPKYGRRKDVSAPTKEKLHSRINAIKKQVSEEVEHNLRGRPEFLTVGDAVERYIDWCKEQGNAPKTLEEKISQLHGFVLPLLSDKNGESARESHFRDVLGKRTGNKRRVLRKVLNHFLKVAEYHYWLPTGLMPKSLGETSAANHSLQPPTELNVQISMKAVKQVIDSAETFNEKVFVYLGFEHGLRIGEICGLRWEDVNFDSMVLEIRQSVTVVSSRYLSGTIYENDAYKKLKTPKTRGSIRDVPMVGRLPKLLLDVPRSDRTGMLIKNRNGGVMSPNTWRGNHWKHICSRAGVKMNPHMMRKVYVSVAQSVGVDEATLTEWIGHKDSKLIRDVYRKAILERQIKDAKKLDHAFTEGVSA